MGRLPRFVEVFRSASTPGGFFLEIRVDAGAFAERVDCPASSGAGFI